MVAQLETLHREVGDLTRAKLDLLRKLNDMADRSLNVEPKLQEMVTKAQDRVPDVVVPRCAFGCGTAQGGGATAPEDPFPTLRTCDGIGQEMGAEPDPHRRQELHRRQVGAVRGIERPEPIVADTWIPQLPDPAH